MLNIQFGYDEGVLLSANDYYDNWVDEDVVLSDFGRKVIKNIDNGDVISKDNIITEVLGSIPQEYLSGGTKALLTLYSGNDVKLSISAMGDNCFPYLVELAKEKDITLYMRNFRNIYENTDLDKVHILNNDKIVDNLVDFAEEFFTWKTGV